ncbi:hypothetical protein DY000_02031356 [Brassica cretica]|uniref:Uncharacterized protein n=1 Tax=Brassica cretica TaxID=69181 RepID=A0ABQ7DQD8_BRACR|nr:hypothetical protein DY000_02031356 [Brassica cretica]
MEGFSLSEVFHFLEGSRVQGPSLRTISSIREAVAKLKMAVPRIPSSYFLHRLFPGNMARLSVSAIYDEHQKAKTRKRRPFYTRPPRLARAASSVNGLSSTSSTGAEAAPNHDPLVDVHRRLLDDLFFLRSQVQDMVTCRIY